MDYFQLTHLWIPLGVGGILLSVSLILLILETFWFGPKRRSSDEVPFTGILSLVVLIAAVVVILSASFNYPE